jgi:hypothetical protein
MEVEEARGLQNVDKTISEIVPLTLSLNTK